MSPRTPAQPLKMGFGPANLRSSVSHRESTCIHSENGYIDAGWIGDIGERRETYANFMAANDLTVPDGYHQPTENDIDAAEAALRTMLDLPDPPTAIFCATDQIALAPLAEALRAGVAVPEEISVVGFDDILWLSTPCHP